jgi:XTP/dITP diphosphohydrolase
MKPMRLLLASGNPKKLAELKAILAQAGLPGLELVTPADIGGLPAVAETGLSFADNAFLKAESGAKHSRLTCLADDSGLEVEALDGAPGVRSARYAGEQASDAENRAKLLISLAHVPAERRRARFVCALALAAPSGELLGQWSGQVEGRIASSESGQGGFGYDPLFLHDEAASPLKGRTFAELSADQKAALSHRGRALKAFAQDLPNLQAQLAT